MNTYVSPTARPARETIARQAQHMSVAMATEAGALIASIAWILYGAVVMLFGLFGVDLFASIQNAQWVTGTAITEFSAISSPLVAYAIGILANLVMGALVGACYAWMHNLFTGPEEM